MCAVANVAIVSDIKPAVSTFSRWLFVFETSLLSSEAQRQQKLPETCKKQISVCDRYKLVHEQRAADEPKR